MHKSILLTVAVLLVTFSCNKQKETPEQKIEYIIFGHFYGFCLGERCIEIFKLTESKLYEDDTDSYPTSAQPYQGNFIEMDEEKFLLVNDLADKIPEELLAEQDTIIGSPDAADGGGIYFAIKNDNGTRYWLIDQMKYNVPNYLHPFMDDINNSILLIQD
jgi:hypothetical protein